MYFGEASGLKLGKAPREAFGETLRDLGQENRLLCTVDADVGNSTRTELFAKANPERAFNVGIAESNLVSIAGGLASCGRIPVIASFAAFLLDNAFDQIRMSVAFPALNVKMVGTHTGISIGEDGPSQMGIEDISLACSLPNLVVVSPSDAACTSAALRALVAHQGPTYMRAGRGKVADVYTNGCAFEIGKAIQVRDGKDVTIIANGLMLAAALDAAVELAKTGVEARVLDMHTVKPIDADAIAAAVRDTGAIVVAEEHLHHGGLGSVVAQTVCALAPAPVEYVDLGDRFAESGDPEGLLEKYGLTPDRIVAAARRAASRK